MQLTLSKTALPPLKRRILISTHFAVLIASVGMICWITKDTMESISFLSSPGYLRFQFWVCLLFLSDIILEFAFSEHRWKYLAANIFFILISIPWTNIVRHFHVELPPMAEYILHFVPMIRAGYVLALISGTLSSNKTINMMTVYIIWVLASLYFGALVFFVAEHYVNPAVTDFWTSLWWASLSMTTVGCDIQPITATGRVIAVLLSMEGLALFPVFAVYITHAIVGARNFRKEITGE